MPLICYKKMKLKPATLDMIAKVNEILSSDDYAGLNLTLRQVYYQFVSRDWLPNTKQSYDNLGVAVDSGRLCGLIDWHRIQDLTRELRGDNVWDNPGQIIGAVANQYRFDKWHDQEYRVEVWIEKDALRGVIEKACYPLNVPFFACRGYVSQSEMWVAAQRLLQHRKNRQEPVIIHLGDHDPSGIDMTRDIRERLTMFRVGGIEVKRIALNMDQVEEYKPPPNPAKTTDVRFRKYAAIHGDESWELDALDPPTLVTLVRDAIMGFADEDKLERAAGVQKKHRAQLKLTSDNWDEVIEHVEDTYGLADDESEDDDGEEEDEET